MQDGVPGTNAVRMYSIAPRSGSAAGGTQITVLGKHFSHYAGNKIQCRFRFETGAETRDEMVDAMLMDDSRLQCTSPATVQQVCLCLRAAALRSRPRAYISELRVCFM
jgi:hypothetical protein